MEISQEHTQVAVKIQSYEAGVITINGETYQKPLLITAENIEHNISVTDSQSLTIEDLKAFNFTDYEVVLIGTGEDLNFPKWELIEEAQCLASPLEVMATGAACRTFTILASEGRKVLALLIP